ncbi:ABC transporter permease [Neorhodopirellula pilleata]|uniref:ABC-2 family transporter protein n=1 Tax=Neorhodopirellula pilleata TaxID=2714738 RepID=A0A5C5ZKV9_9BACT|nr:ABC-2 transporter permease [Neorhodopirellula pilleata]TWT87808.1 ABC-2 family transporter protein [Neorhodopirellula pilleata]
MSSSNLPLITPPIRVLLWKDLRQLLPLVAMLIVVTFLLWIAGLIFRSGVEGNVTVWLPLAMPSLLAAGAGAILVGNEKETRTLRWVVSLPISFSTVFRSKLLAAAIGLVLMWIVAFVFLTVMGYTLSNNHLAFWIVHTVFLLTAGLFTAWRIENAFGGLIALLPIASIPFLLANLAASVVYQQMGRYVSPEQVVQITTWMTFPAIIFTVWLGHRAAARFFDADPAPPSLPSSTDVDAWRPPRAAMPSQQPYRSSASSLVWQSIHHSPVTLAGLSAMLLIGVVAFALIVTREGGRFAGGLLGGLSLLAPLSLSWLGVFAFAGDGSTSRLRFMADRGVSPTRVWWTRHAVPTAMIAAALLAYYATQRLILVDGLERAGPVFSVACIGAIAACVYGISQWTGQLIRVLGGSAFLAPLLSGMTVLAAIASVGPMGNSPWLLLIGSILPFFATWSTMRWHMDDTRSLRFWLIHAGLVALMIGLPIANFAWDVAQFPAMSTQRRNDVLQAASTLSWPPRHPRSIPSRGVEQLDWSERSLDDKRSGQEMVDFLQTIDDVPSDYLILPVDPEVPLRADHIDSMIGSTEYHRLKAVANTGNSSAESVNHFAIWSDFLVEMVGRFRLSYRINDQCGADALEIYLIQAYAKPEMRSLWETEFAQRAIRLVADQTSRNAARRRAVLASYRYFVEGQVELNDNGKPIAKEPHLGGYDLGDVVDYLPVYQIEWVIPRAGSEVTDALLRMIEAGESGQPTFAMRQRLHQCFFGKTAMFEAGPYADRLRVSAHPRDTANVHFVIQYPGSQWYAAWEQDAIKLQNQTAPPSNQTLP